MNNLIPSLPSLYPVRFTIEHIKTLIGLLDDICSNSNIFLNSLSDTAPGKSILFASIAIGTFANSSLDNNAYFHIINNTFIFKK